MTDYKKLAGQAICDIVPYKPGKPVKELERELGIKEAVKLASNENPFGPSPKVKTAIKDFFPEISRYPFGDAHYLRTKLAAKLEVPADMLLFGTGSNEIIELAIRTFLKDGEHVISPAPSFSVYSSIAQAAGKTCKWIPCNEDFSFNFKALLDAVDEKTRMIFIANPNNPTGAYTKDKDLKAFMEKVPSDVIVVMDEAYVEFADAKDFPDTMTYLDKFKNIFIMRTFSKAYGLAALRVGYCVADAMAIDMMNRVRQPFNTNMAGQVAAEAALEDQAYLQKVVRKNKKGRNYIQKEFKKMGLKYIPSQSNFVLVEVGDGEKVFNELLKKGVIVRYLGPGLKPYVRVSVGTMSENEFFIEQLKKVLGK
ncbi:MAG: histidinol-phosphate transaminase [Deferribacterales bacterium]